MMQRWLSFALALALLAAAPALARADPHWPHKGQATLSLSFNPPNPSVPDSSPVGTIVAQAVPAWSDGSQFTGTVAFASPYFSDGGVFALDSNFNVIISASGPGLTGDGGTVQNATVNATQ